jgi:hypothetical protein
MIRIPNNMAKAGWDIDVDFLRAFCDHFGITWDISIRWTSGRYTHGSAGVKTNSDGKESHHITLSQIWPQGNATVTLLHELCHCIQREKAGSHEKFMSEYKQYSSVAYSGRYLANPFEVEARNFADDNVAEWGAILY